MSSNNGHWVGVTANTHDYLGFIYKITHKKTGKSYIGKRQYFYLKQPRKRGCKSITTDRSSPQWRSSCWRENSWRDYTGSSKKFNKYIKTEGKDNFTFEILGQFKNKSSLHYAEIEALVNHGVLWRKDSNGEYVFFNRQIPAIRFRVDNYECES
jgi:hypothetical protein